MSKTTLECIGDIRKEVRRLFKEIKKETPAIFGFLLAVWSTIAMLAQIDLLLYLVWK
jgi:hypothetical protein